MHLSDLTYAQEMILKALSRQDFNTFRQLSDCLHKQTHLKHKGITLNFYKLQAMGLVDIKMSITQKGRNLLDEKDNPQHNQSP